MRLLLLAVVGSAGTSVAIGAALGALISGSALVAGTTIQGRHRRNEQRRDRMMATADDFVSLVAGADALYRDIVLRSAGRRIDEMRWATDEVARSAARLRIAFGPDSEVTVQTGTVIRELTEARDCWPKRNKTERREAAERISKEMHCFTAKASGSLWHSSAP